MPGVPTMKLLCATCRNLATVAVDMRLEDGQLRGGLALLDCGGDHAAAVPTPPPPPDSLPAQAGAFVASLSVEQLVPLVLALDFAGSDVPSELLSESQRSTGLTIFARLAEESDRLHRAAAAKAPTSTPPAAAAAPLPAAPTLTVVPAPSEPVTEAAPTPAPTPAETAPQS